MNKEVHNCRLKTAVSRARTSTWIHENWLVFASERHKEEKDMSKPCPFFYFNSSMQMKKLNRLKEKMKLNIPSFILEVLLPNLNTHVVPFFFIYYAAF